MTQPRYLANAVLWAVAIVAAALAGAPNFLTLILLPSLASCSLLLTMPARKRAACRS